MIHFQPSGAHDWTVCVVCVLPVFVYARPHAYMSSYIDVSVHVSLRSRECEPISHAANVSKCVQAVDHRHSDGGAACLIAWLLHEALPRRN